MSDSESDSDGSSGSEKLRKTKRNAKFESDENDSSEGEDDISSSGSGDDDDEVTSVSMTESDSDTDDDDAVATTTRPTVNTRKSKRNRRQLATSSSDSDSEPIRSRRRAGTSGTATKKIKPYIYAIGSDESDSSWAPLVGGEIGGGVDPLPGPSGVQSVPARAADNADDAAHSSDGNNNDSSDSNGDDNDGNGTSSEKCPICLHKFREQEIGQPAVCAHSFCAPCIEEWSNNVQTCPIDRLEFNEIIVRSKFGPDGQLVRRVPVIVKQSTLDADADDDSTPCEVCRNTDREDTMLLCDGCNRGYHMSCLTPPLTEIPQNSWYCDYCFASENSSSNEEEVGYLIEQMEILGVPETRLRVRRVNDNDNTPRILRTRQSERIRATILSRIAPSRRHAPLDSLGKILSFGGKLDRIILFLYCSFGENNSSFYCFIRM